MKATKIELRITPDPAIQPSRSIRLPEFSDRTLFQQTDKDWLLFCLTFFQEFCKCADFGDTLRAMYRLALWDQFGRVWAALSGVILEPKLLKDRCDASSP
jgi:hypothetical protein